MPFTNRLCEGFKKCKKHKSYDSIIKKGIQDLQLDISMVWRSLHHKDILLSEPGRYRRECIYSRTSPFIKLLLLADVFLPMTI